MMQDQWSAAAVGIRPTKSAPCSPIKPILPMRSESFHAAHKVPLGDTPYVRAKRVQLVDKDPEKAIALFWAAINAGDRVDSALKDMAIVMKQQNRTEEAVEAIKSLRSRCSEQAQESLDNILLDLYKKCGRLEDQITLLRHKLHLIQQGVAFNGKRTKTARSQGRKFQVSLEQEATRLLGNLGWALMQQDNYAEAEGAYRRALLIGPDSNKMCNLGICLMKQGRVAEAKQTLKRVRPAMADGPRGVDSHLKAFDRAQEMLRDLETKTSCGGNTSGERWPSEVFFPGASSVWQPQPCLDLAGPQDGFGDENVDVNWMAATRGVVGGGSSKAELTTSLMGSSNPLNIAAPPFYSTLVKKTEDHVVVDRFQDPLGNLKRSRSGGEVLGNLPLVTREKAGKPKVMMPPPALAGSSDKWVEDLLPDEDAFDQAIVAAVLAPVLEAAEAATAAQAGNAGHGAATTTTTTTTTTLDGRESKVGKRLRVFEDITHCLSPRA